MMSKFKALLSSAVNQAAGTALGIAFVGFITYTFLGVSEFHTVKDGYIKNSSKFEKSVESFEAQKQGLIDRQNLLSKDIISMTSERIVPIDERVKVLEEALKALKAERTINQSDDVYFPKYELPTPSPVTPKVVKPSKPKPTLQYEDDDKKIDFKREYEDYQLQQRMQNKLKHFDQQQMQQK
jgi:uncharacterized protein YoxC